MTVPRRHLPVRWRVALAALVLLIVAMLLYLGLCTYIAATMTHARRQPLTVDPRGFGLQVEDVSFPSREDHLQLRGWLLSAPGTVLPAGSAGRLIIIVHGWNSIRDDTNIGIVPIAAALVQRGYPVLLFDLRGFGQSEGDRFSLGWYEQRDLEGALDWAEQRGFTRIGVHAFSMGGATAILTAAYDHRIAAVATDSTFAAVVPVLWKMIPQQSGMPSLVVPGTLLMERLLFGVNAYAVRPVDAMPQLRDRPVLTIHGEADYVPVAQAEQLWAARYGPTGDPARRYIQRFPNAGHVHSYRTDPARYLAVVTDFWQTALP